MILRLDKMKMSLLVLLLIFISATTRAQLDAPAQLLNQQDPWSPPQTPPEDREGSSLTAPEEPTQNVAEQQETQEVEQALTVANPNVKQVERHLIMMGCKSAFWLRMKKRLETNIPFTSSVCIYSDENEVSNIQRILQRKLDHPDHDIHVVATLLTANHCLPEVRDQCQAKNQGEHYLPLLEAGVRGWFLEAEPDFEALGVNRTATGIESTELFPDNSNGGSQVAQEFCRLGASIAPATIAVLYGSPEAAHSTARIQSFIDGLQEYCPEARHQIKYSFYAEWSADKAAAVMSPVFLRDGGLHAVIAANDDMALGALVSAKEMRPDKQLLVAGYDANAYTIPLLQSGAMFATVDQSPPTGIAYSLQVMLSDQANGGTDFGAPSECALSPNPSCSLEDYNTIRSASWKQLNSDLPNKVQTAVTIRVKDPSSLVLRERLQLYNKAVRPPATDNSPTPVNAQLVATKVFEVYTEASSILAQAVLVLTWQDNRLRWSDLIHPDVKSIHVDIEDIWSPIVVLSNLLKSGFTVPLTNIETTLYPNGTVVWEQTVNTGEFRCGSIEQNVFKFPFDTQLCGIDLTSHSIQEFVLFADDGDFDVDVANDDWFQGDIEVHMEMFGATHETIEYRVEMMRDPMFIVLSIIVPSFLLNTISFAQHWIPTRTGAINLDRGGMAITTILAALALRDTMVAEVGNAFTLLDLFLLVSLVFQFLGFLITAYESSYGRVKGQVDENEQGIGDRLGKVVTPLLFGLFCLSLSLYWGDGVWILFYLAMVLIMFTAYLGRRDHHMFRQGLKKRLTNSKKKLRSRLGMADMIAKQEGETEGAQETAESVVRYLRWQALKKKELASRSETSNAQRIPVEEESSETFDDVELDDGLQEAINEVVEAEKRLHRSGPSSRDVLRSSLAGMRHASFRHSRNTGTTSAATSVSSNFSRNPSPFAASLGGHSTTTKKKQPTRTAAMQQVDAATKLQRAFRARRERSSSSLA